MTELQVIYAVLGVMLIAAGHLHVQAIVLRRQIARLEREVELKGSEWKLESVSSRCWDISGRFDSLCKHLGITIDKSPSTWEVLK